MSNRVLKAAMYVAMGMSLAAALPATVAHAAAGDGSLVGRLVDAGDPQLDMFYLGGLDAYRIAFNDDYSQPFAPPKQHFRSETVDLQRGEVEWRGGNLYFDKWDYTFQAKVSSPQNIRTSTR